MKCVKNTRQLAFDDDVAIALVEEARENEEITDEDARELGEIVCGDLDQGERSRLWNEWWYDHTADCEFPTADDWTPSLLRRVEALRMFVHRLNADEAAPTADEGAEAVA